MKLVPCLFGLALAAAAWGFAPEAAAQELSSTNASPPIALEQPNAADRANQIRRGRLLYSGSAVQAVKHRSLLQLLNPFAPPSAGTGLQNTAIDPITGQVVGLKLFAVSK